MYLVLATVGAVSARSHQLLPEVHYPSHVFADDIKFEIYRIAYLYLIEVSVFERIGDDGYGEPIGLGVHYRKADAVDRNRPLFYCDIALSPVILERI